MSELSPIKMNEWESYIGMYFSGDAAWRIECPCGVVATYPINKLPEVDTPHPCGNPKHWTVRFDSTIEPPA